MSTQKSTQSGAARRAPREVRSPEVPQCRSTGLRDFGASDQANFFATPVAKCYPGSKKRIKCYPGSKKRIKCYPGSKMLPR